MLERKFSMKFLLFCVIISSVIGIQAVVSFYDAPSIIMDSLAIFGCLAFVLMICFCREDITVSWNFFFGVEGMYIGLIANISLSTGFVSKPSLIFVITNLLVTLLLFWTIFALRKDINLQDKLVFVFLGCWVVSLLLAVLGFYQSLSIWLSLLPQQEKWGDHIQVEASVIINILKSLFLSSVFNVLERVTQLSKKEIK